MPNDGATQSFPSASTKDFSPGRYMVMLTRTQEDRPCLDLATYRTFGDHSDALAYCRSVADSYSPVIVEIVGDKRGFFQEVF